MHAFPDQRTDTQTTRQGGFDLLRITMALVVVILHAAIPYLQVPIAGLAWPVHDASHLIPHGLGWASLMFVMPVFLLMSGYLSAAKLQSLQGFEFLRTRARRLLLPLVTLGPVILTMDLYVWLTGWLIEGRITARKLRSLAFDPGEAEGLWGLSHLWYLPYVFLYGLALTAATKLLRTAKSPHLNDSATDPATAPRTPASLTPRSTLFTLLACWLIAVLTAAAAPAVAYGFQHAWLPVPSKWIFCGTFFAMGATLFFAPPRMAANPRLYRFLLTVGAGCTAAAVVVAVPTALVSNIVPSNLATLRNAVLAASAGSCIALGLFGWAQQSKLPSGRALSYLAAASFWIYLIHHPVVGLAHVTLATSLGDSLSAPTKCLLAFTAGVSVSLLSFELLGRRAPLARLLAIPHALRKSKPAANSPAASSNTPSHTGNHPDADAQPRSGAPAQPSGQRAA